MTGSHLINDDWVASRGERFNATNPATGEQLEPAFAEAGEAEVDGLRGEFIAIELMDSGLGIAPVR